MTEGGPAAEAVAEGTLVVGVAAEGGTGSEVTEDGGMKERVMEERASVEEVMEERVGDGVEVAGAECLPLRLHRMRMQRERWLIQQSLGCDAWHPLVS